MAIPMELERRFRVTGETWRPAAHRSSQIRQGYITDTDGVTVRVRRIGERGYITIKTPPAGIARAELEYEIPAEHADFLIASTCGSRTIDKVRHEVLFAGRTWTVDEFQGTNAGLVLAEIELDAADRAISLPEWVGLEVTTQTRFHNSYLSRHPFGQWRRDDAA